MKLQAQSLSAELRMERWADSCSLFPEVGYCANDAPERETGPQRAGLPCSPQICSCSPGRHEQEHGPQQTTRNRNCCPTGQPELKPVPEAALQARWRRIPADSCCPRNLQVIPAGGVLRDRGPAPTKEDRDHEQARPACTIAAA